MNTFYTGPTPSRSRVFTRKNPVEEDKRQKSRGWPWQGQPFSLSFLPHPSAATGSSFFAVLETRFSNAEKNLWHEPASQISRRGHNRTTRSISPDARRQGSRQPSPTACLYAAPFGFPRALAAYPSSASSAKTGAVRPRSACQSDSRVRRGFCLCQSRAMKPTCRDVGETAAAGRETPP